MDADSTKTLTTLEVCHRLSISKSGLAKMVKDGLFPPPVRITKDLIWFEADVGAILYLRSRGMWRRKRPAKSRPGRPGQGERRAKIDAPEHMIDVPGHTIDVNAFGVGFWGLQRRQGEGNLIFRERGKPNEKDAPTLPRGVAVRGKEGNMADLESTRKQRLRTLENDIRKDYEAFVRTGFALKEIRDQELYKEDGFETWDRYLRERVGLAFGIEQRQVYQLIAAAQIRIKMPEPPVCTTVQTQDEKPIWSQKAVLEFGRLAPREANGEGRARDFDQLDKRDVQRVAKKVEKHCEQTGERPTATVVRKFVDELGVDRSAQARETKQKREEAMEPELRQFLVDLTGRIEAETEKLQTVSSESWKLFQADSPKVAEPLAAACTALAEMLKRVTK